MIALLAAVTAVGVGLSEYQVAVYRPTVRAGVVKLNVTDLGQDPHDLVVRRAGKVYARVPELRPGERRTVRVRLRKPGRYVLFCSLADHEARGMKARLRVRAAPRDRTARG